MDSSHTDGLGKRWSPVMKPSTPQRLRSWCLWHVVTLQPLIYGWLSERPASDLGSLSPHHLFSRLGGLPFKIDEPSLTPRQSFWETLVVQMEQEALRWLTSTLWALRRQLWEIQDSDSPRNWISVQHVKRLSFPGTPSSPRVAQKYCPAACFTEQKTWLFLRFCQGV